MLSLRIPSNPKDAPGRNFFSEADVPAPVARTLRNACADCHSDETVWPWYAHAPIVSFLLVHEVDQARQHLNFSDWQSVREKGPEELAASYSGICENLLSGAMPKANYSRMHLGARLSKEQVLEICSWTNKQQSEILRSSVAAFPVSRRDN
jgi:hypothetical protein